MKILKCPYCYKNLFCHNKRPVWQVCPNCFKVIYTTKDKAFAFKDAKEYLPEYLK